MAERPALAPPPRENVAEQLLGLLPVEEMRLVGRALVGVARRQRDAVDAEFGHGIEERRRAGWIDAVEQGGIDVDPKAARPRRGDRRNGTVMDAVLAYRPVVRLAVAVEMDRERQIPGRREQIELLLQEQRVGAEIDVFAARDDGGDHVADLAVDERFAAGDRDDRRAAFLDRGERLVKADPPVEDGLGIVDLAASGAGQVAAEQRLQHQHQRIAADAAEPLAEDIGPDTPLLR